jgi:bifunctional UDP-N-acetylglucosamine pyrophosphorylase/glucosamine-1-phosphate N-acetyltransferase
VIGYGKDRIKEVFGDRYTYAIQDEQLGTGHALHCAKELIGTEHKMLIVLSADQPTLSKKTLESMISRYKEKKPTIILGTVAVDNFDGWKISIYNNFGRIVRNAEGLVERIVEVKDATPEEKEIREFNLSLYAFDSDWLWKNIHLIKNDNKQGEYYLTDLIKIASEQGEKVEAVRVDNVLEGLHPNSKVELELLESLI